MGILLKAGATPGGCARLLLLVRFDCATLVRGGGAGVAPGALLEAWHAKQRMAQVRPSLFGVWLCSFALAAVC